MVASRARVKALNDASRLRVYSLCWLKNAYEILKQNRVMPLRDGSRNFVFKFL